MTNPTTPFSWQMPTSTDLVTDLPADFETFGQAVATSMADLLGGTTGQILSKASNTNMDFTWVTNDVGDITAVTAGTGISGGGTSGAVTITNSMATEITASGDIIVGTGSGTFDNLPIGTTGQILTADTTVSPYKVKWATPTSSSAFTKITSGSVSGNSSYSVNNCFSSTYTNYKIFIKCTAVTNASDDLFLKLRASGTDSSTGLYSARVFGYSPGVGGGIQTDNAANWFLGLMGSGNPAVPTYNLDVFSPEAATKTTFTGTQLGVNASYFVINQIAGYANNNTQYDGFTFNATGNFSADYIVYGYGV